MTVSAVTDDGHAHARRTAHAKVYRESYCTVLGTVARRTVRARARARRAAKAKTATYLTCVMPISLLRFSLGMWAIGAVGGGAQLGIRAGTTDDGVLSNFISLNGLKGKFWGHNQRTTARVVTQALSEQ